MNEGPAPAGGEEGAAARLRREVRAFLDEHFTPAVARAVADPTTDAGFAARRAWNATLVDGGWGAVGWPVEHGGRAATVLEQVAYHEEMARAGAPGPVNDIGVANIAPAIMAFGRPEQKERFLRPLLRGDEVWSQGMSEPEAGSDLAALRCQARRDGDHFVVSGQKTWTSHGHRADWCQLYVRTDPDAPKRRGISCLLVDMTTPGIEVRPLTTITGETAFAEVFLDGARIPARALLGDLHDGWRVATRTLSAERAGVAPLYLHLRGKLDRLVAEVPGTGGDGSAATPTAVHRAALARRSVEVGVLELLARRSLGSQAAGRPPGPEGSVIKLAWSSADQALAATAVDLLGPAALDGPWARNLLASRSLSIAGGTSEVNRTILAERVLGLPREPDPG